MIIPYADFLEINTARSKEEVVLCAWFRSISPLGWH